MTAALPDAPSSPAVPLRALDRRARLDAIARTMAGVALWSGLLVVTYWWAGDGGIQDLSGWVSGPASVGRLSGLVAAFLLLVQVLLMARLPVLEGAFGQDRLARLHRLVGFTSFDLMVLHVVLATYADAGGLGRAPVALWGMVRHDPGMLLAAGGTVALVMVVVTSVRAARRRIRYESWHLLHLYAYLGVGLALPHQLWAGQQFVSSPTRTIFWWTVWALAAGSVLAWRVSLPLWRNLRHRLRVTSVVAEGHGVVSVHLTGRRMDRFPAEAGQYLSWRFLTGRGWTRANPFSLSAAPDGRSLRITVQAVGDGSVATAALRPGTRALVEGPYGRLSARRRTRPKVALIGAGVGITPLRALAEGLDYAPGEAVLLHRYAADPLFVGELENIGRDRGLRLVASPGHRRAAGSWLGSGVGDVDDVTALRSWVPDIAEHDVYVCGPARWTALVRTTLLEAGVPPALVHVETFSW